MLRGRRLPRQIWRWVSSAGAPAADGEGAPSGPHEPVAPPPWRHWLRLAALGLLLVLVALPLLLLAAYRFLPPPMTPLMLIRLLEGEGLSQSWVPLAQIAPALPRAVIAAEDNRFCEHRGFDWQAIGEVLADVRAGRERPRGASTLTMQTAKNLFLWPGRSLLRKGGEAWLTPQIELLWPKRRIMEVYLNIAELGPGIYGAEAAAQAYFGKPAAALSNREAALLAAVLPNPRRWSPAAPTAYIERRVRAIGTRVRQLGPMLACIETQ
jgi:monofunctional biosynthetic peptidoglycan transglycosylase